MPATPRDHSEHDVLEPHVEPVAEGAYAYLQLWGQWGLNNAGFLIGRDAVTLVDTCFTVRRAQALLQAIRGHTDKPIRTLLNTHHHGDHTYGNFLVSGATIIGHELCRAEMLATGLSTQDLFAPGTDWGPIEIAPPVVTFRDRLNVYVDELEIQAHYVGPAHTSNDVVYYVPDLKLMFSGDLVFNGGTPFTAMGSVQGSFVAYERLAEFDVEVVVPGHGGLTDGSAFEQMSSYLRFVWALAQEGYAQGVSPLEVARNAELGLYGEWHDSERLVANVHRAYSELRGDPLGVRLPLDEMVRDMVVLNGGEPLRCRA